MTISLVRGTGAFAAVAKKPDALVSAILPMIPSVHRAEVHALLKDMSLTELTHAYDRAVAARTTAGQSVTNQDLAAGLAVLTMPRLVHTQG